MPTAPPGAPEAPEPVALEAEEREIVAAIAAAYAEALPQGLAARVGALADAAREGTVPPDLVGVLERVCAVALETGRARELGRAEAECVLAAVSRRTPAGRRAARAVEEVNRALAPLAGRRLRSVRVATPLPGRATIAIEVEGLALSLAVGPDGVLVQSLAAG
ncbi:MAG TPA: hypothetical protein VNO79_01675 [Actinomycetota bacterium]|nr:hypothetical protein [Actinomycetota bacterium]